MSSKLIVVILGCPALSAPQVGDGLVCLLTLSGLVGEGERRVVGDDLSY